MSPPQPRSIAQPGKTAAGHAAERDLDAYVRETALHVPLEFVDRVMAAIEAETPTRRWFPVLASSERSRSRMAGVAAALMAALIGGGALVAGASGIIGRDVAMPASVGPASQPILFAGPTPTPTANADEPTTRPAIAPAATQPSGADRPDAGAPTEETEETQERDEPEATDRADGDEHANDPEETDEPGDDGSTGRSDRGGEDEGADDSTTP
jgi:hypothetical protein